MSATLDNAPAIEAQRLTKIYGSGNTEVVALKDVSLRVPRGEVVALLGPSGAGKSTLLTAIGLINPPTSGRVAIGGVPVLEADRPLVNLRAFRRQHLGFVFQKANLIPFLSALQNVQVALEINDVPPRRARSRSMELLEYLGVADRAANLPDALSGGQQQRVAVARALANQPSLILADEPTAALDSQRGRQVMELFRKVAHEHGAGVLVVTHDHRALDVFDRAYEMEDGRLKPGADNDFKKTQTPVKPALIRAARGCAYGTEIDRKIESKASIVGLFDGLLWQGVACFEDTRTPHGLKNRQNRVRESRARQFGGAAQRSRFRVCG